MAEGSGILETIAEEVQEEYRQRQHFLSFSEYLDKFEQHPRRQARNAVQYMRDCLLYWGTETKPRGWDEVRHFNLFDAPFDEGKDRLIGQEESQERLYKLFESFVRQGDVDKLILLHGPNGSAKSSFVDLLMRGLEAYSRTDDGAMYRFNWVFPNESLAEGTSIGFDGFSARAVEESSLETFAYLEEDEIDVKIPSDLNDHPLLLVPEQQRRQLLEEHVEDLVIPGVEDADREPFQDGSMTEDLEALRDERPFVASDYMVEGQLSHMSRQIFDALLAAYDGDLEQVFKHVQVERIFISRRYRVGTAIVEPQKQVDAGLRQVSVDRSLSALPSSLQNQNLFEPVGDLVDANRGLIEYDDLLKRPPELNKYLLATSEKGTVTLQNRIVHLDMVMTATANEDYLDAFKQTPDYESFKGRMELIQMPYLLDYQVEEIIYEEQISSVSYIKPFAPHTTMVAALWAVLTRLERPDPDEFEDEIEEVISELGPLEKADLYARGRVPEDIGPEKARNLKAAVPKMRRQDEGSEYEGRYGASPREMKMILLNASQNDEYPCLSPLAVFDELETLVNNPSDFPFLQREPEGPYHRFDDFIDTVRERYLDVIDAEIRHAMGLVEEEQYEDLFEKYIDHISQWLKDEKVYNPITSTYEEPDEELMVDMEDNFTFEESEEDFRRGLISSIAAFSIDHSEQSVDYREIFPELFEGLEESFYEERQEKIHDIQQNLMDYFEGDTDKLSSKQQEDVETTLQNLKEDYGYTEESAREAIAFLLSNRY